MDKVGDGNQQQKKQVEEVIDDDPLIKKKYVKAFDHLCQNIVK
jgi:hypothetical protein